MKKNHGSILPKNVDKTEDYKPPKSRKRVEVEEADDGTFSIKCYGDNGDEWRGGLKTASSLEDMHSKVAEHFGKKSTKKA